MKKIVYTLSLALLAASCSEDYKDWSVPQTNPQEEAKTVTLETAAAVDVEFSSLDSTLVQLFVPTVTATDENTTTYKVTLWNADASASQTIDADANGYASADDVKAAVETLYGKRPEMRTVAMDIVGYTLINGQSIKNTSTGSINITLKAPFIAEAYYLIGDMLAWSKEGAKAFTHKGSGDVYDNPEFEVVFTITATEDKANDWYWKIIPATNYDGENFWAEGETGVVGVAVDGDDSFEGLLTTTAPQAGKIVNPGIYKMTINMMNYTYAIEELHFTEYIYEIGGLDWSNSRPLYGANFDGKYQGYYWINGEFKFKPNADNWDGDWEDAGNGLMTDAGGPNMSVAEAGFYQIDVDLTSMTYATTKVESISIIGTVNGNWDTDTDLTYNQETGAWEVVADLNAGKMKFRMNHGWDVSWGGANGDAANYDNLTQHGGVDLDVAAGKYLVQLYIQYEGANKVVLTPQ